MTCESDRDESSIEQRDPSETSFYEARHLPEPTLEWWPRDRDELRRLVRGASDAERPRLLLGRGQHVRTNPLGRQEVDVIRTEACDAICARDSESGTIRVECGMTWGALHTHLNDSDWALHGYRLYPRDATIGGLLAHAPQVERQFRTGDLREGCIALNTVTPAGADYSYLAAPRKASGPDFRYLYIESEGALGAILDARLILHRERSGRLCLWPDATLRDADRVRKHMERLDLDPTWTHWSPDDGLRLALHAPPPLLDAYLERLESEEWPATLEIEGHDAARETRERLERRPLGCRSTPSAPRTRVCTVRQSDLVRRVETHRDEFEHVEIIHWGPHHARLVWVRPEGAPPLSGEYPSLADRFVVDDGGFWPERWSPVKRRLDPEGGLAIGPSS